MRLYDGIFEADYGKGCANLIRPIVVDFETDAIVGSPIVKPPKPCGVAIEWPGEAPKYYGWGHPTNNNCTFETAVSALAAVAQSGLPVLFHHAAFDLSVWRKWIPQVRIPWDWHGVHDTLYLVFLADPYANTFSLKPSAERWLNLPPDEQTALKNWILQHVPQATPKEWGAYISLAPGDLVGDYAKGDVHRTGRLFEKLHPMICEQGMELAYDRERRSMPVLMIGTRRGVRVERERLEKDERDYTRCLDIADDRLCQRIGITREQLEDDEEALKDGLERCGAVKEWVLTPKSSKRSMAAGNLKIVIPEINDLLDYRGALKTSLQTFMRPWLAFSADDGRLHPNWNQVRQAKGDYASKGARTGRLSSDEPNFQNLPTKWKYKNGQPMPVPKGLLPYPLLRQYILPEIGHYWLKRDFSSQEVRILAHFEDGSLKTAYIANPNLDPHAMAQELIAALVGIQLSRDHAKIIGFSIIYGTGKPGLSASLGVSLEKAGELKSAYLSAMPDVNTLMRDVQFRGRADIGIRTWGGRVYFREPGVRDFSYKLLNYLIQGSAADQTKDCICEWDATRNSRVIFLATVHDEINISAPIETWQEDMQHLERVMNRDRFDVPFLSEGFYGPNWYDLKKAA